MTNRASYMTALNDQDIFLTISGDRQTSRAKSANLTNQPPSWLLTGEEVKMHEPCVGYEAFNGRIDGTVWVTNYRLRFQELHKTHGLVEDGIIDVPLGSISKIEKYGHSNVRRDGTAYGIRLKCKDMRKMIFYHSPENHSRRQLYENLRLYAFPNTNKLPFFATVYKGAFRNDGWSVYNPRAEFARMRVPDELWATTTINETYDFASTYPACLVLPQAAIERGAAFIEAVGEFRSKKRIPVLTWYKSETKAAICRCAQPLVGVTSRHSAEDEALLQLIIDANPGSGRLTILDARPLVNARVNKAVGGGYEENYANCDLAFLGIENIHVIRESLKRVKTACYPRIDYKNFYKNLDDTKWLAHIQTILAGAGRVVAEILERRSVLVHCSDGWDRTAQLTSLAMLQLDAYYRTLVGFIVLVEKEWCSFGHKFAHVCPPAACRPLQLSFQRIGHGEDKHGDEERSPIFVQFLDCVWQLYNQFTLAFEFNVNLLKTILDELYACRFGTFLYNSEKERADLEVKTTTVSLWSLVLDRRAEFVNPLYDPAISTDANYFNTTTSSAFCTKLWTDYYCRYNPQVIAPELSALDESSEATSFASPPHVSRVVAADKNGNPLTASTTF